MHELPGEHVNEHGGRQSKLYCEYRLLDASAMHALTCVLHRGKKYGIDNWRLIPTHEHLNHAMNHIMAHVDYARLRNVAESRKNIVSHAAHSLEDDLAHAFCRLMFALAKEIEEYGIHPEHSAAQYHEPAATPTKSDPVRESGPILGGVHPTHGVDKNKWYPTASSNQTGRDNIVGPQEASSRNQTGY